MRESPLFKRRMNMSFALRQYFPPDFEKESLKNAPDAALVQVPMDQVAPEGYQYHQPVVSGTEHADTAYLYAQ